MATTKRNATGKKLTRLPYSHTFYFELSETTDAVVDRFIDACDRYLRHPGQTYFAIGVRDRAEQRGVSQTFFEVSVNMVFRNKADYDEYRTDPKHMEFVTETAGMSPYREVFDSYLKIQRTAKKGGKK